MLTECCIYVVFFSKPFSIHNINSYNITVKVGNKNYTIDSGEVLTIK